MTNKYPPIYIAGPTATGKSDLALRLASKVDSVIISADSMQVYRGLDIGTAKVSREIRKQFEHKLIDIKDVDEEFSVAEFKQLAQNEIFSAQKRGKLPIVAGGTGLYFDALLYPLSFSNAIKNEPLRQTLRQEYEQYGAEYLHNKLEQLDKKSADRLHKNDAKRVIRALEIVLTTGKPMSETTEQSEPADAIMIGLTAPREILYERVNARVDKMFEEGLVDEVLSIGNFDYQCMQAIGYKEFNGCEFSKDGDNFVIEKDKLDEIKSLIKQHTRNYCKRQLTWFRKYDFIKWFDISSGDEAIDYILSRLKNYAESAD